jgi:TFIIF-interacting CTD phosphatase-like protein
MSFAFDLDNGVPI